MIEFLAGLALGLGGSLHCAGMCGPIAISLPSARGANRVADLTWQETSQKLLYQFGRVTTYTTLGAMLGFGGSWIAIAGYGRTLSIVSGLAMIAALLLQLVWNRQLISGKVAERWVAPVKRSLSSLLVQHGALTHYGIGILNGLLPCGLVSAALLGSLGTGSLFTGTIFMFGFGLGTVPLMSAIALGGSRISCQVRKRLRYAAPAISLVIASLFLLRGLALGIPHLSPGAPGPEVTTVGICH